MKLKPKWLAKDRIEKLFFKEDGGKKRLRTATVCTIIIVPVVLGLVCNLIIVLHKDTSFIGKGSKPSSAVSAAQPANSAKGNLASMFAAAADAASGKGITGRKYSKGGGQKEKINYKAKQVVTRDDALGLGEGLPTGTNMIARLSTSIDTREAGQLVKVTLPYGASYKQNLILEKDTELLGAINYPGTGDKVFIRFSSGVLPGGKEFKIDAIALSTKDFSSGIEGETHSEADTRIATTLGLTMVSGMADVMTEKESLSDRQVPVAKATLKNAFYNGVAKTSEMEAEREAGELSARKDYLTVDVGADIVVSLTAPIKKDNL